MTGTIRNRLDAVVGALLAQRDLSLDMLSIGAHPNAIRPFALEFDPKTSEGEIVFGDSGSITWKGVGVHQHRHLGDEQHIFVCIERGRAVRVPIFGSASIDPDCRPQWREIVAKALASIEATP